MVWPRLWVLSHTWIRHVPHVKVSRHIQPMAFVASFNLSLQSQSHWSLFDGTWQKRPRKLENRLRFEIEEMTLQMQLAVDAWRGPVYESCHTHEWVMSHISLNPWIMSHISMCHATHMNDMAPFMSHVSRMNASCPTYQWITSPHNNVSHHIYM